MAFYKYFCKPFLKIIDFQKHERIEMYSNRGLLHETGT